MDLISEFFIELVFRRVIVGILGYYTLYTLYKLTNNKKGMKWLIEASEHEGEEFGKGCMIGVVGLVSLSTLTLLIVYFLT